MRNKARVSLVYDADAEYRTPDEQMASQIRQKLKEVTDGMQIEKLFVKGVLKCMERHVVEGCYLCPKFGFCAIHRLDIDVASGNFGVENVGEDRK